MPAGFYKLKVDRITRETPDAVSIRLLVPPPLKGMFTYKSGQYLTLHQMINGEDVRRSYSVCTSPYDDAMPTVAVKQVVDGRMSTFLNQSLKEGDLIEAMPPMGNFSVEPEAGKQGHYVLFGGGSGITPLMSIAKTVLGQEPLSKVTLVYANRNEESIIFRKEIDQLATDVADRFKVVHILDEAGSEWTGLTGMLNPLKVNQLLKQEVGPDLNAAHYYICGPTGMMQMIETTLQDAGTGKENIHLEYFTAVKKDSDSEEKSEIVATEGTKHIKIELFGDHHEVTIDDNKTILEAAQDAGIDPPYSCTVGVCTTCRAKVHSGKVSMDEREGLSDAEIEEGYVLTCQSHPLTDVDLTFE